MVPNVFFHWQPLEDKIYVNLMWKGVVFCFFQLRLSNFYEALHHFARKYEYSFASQPKQQVYIYSFNIFSVNPPQYSTKVVNPGECSRAAQLRYKSFAATSTIYWFQPVQRMRHGGWFPTPRRPANGLAIFQVSHWISVMKPPVTDFRQSNFQFRKSTYYETKLVAH